VILPKEGTPFYFHEDNGVKTLAMLQMVSQAVILAGGKGERLGPLTQSRPKVMVEAFGRPLIDYQLRWLSSYGVQEIVIAAGHLGGVIKDYFGDGSKWKVSITYAVEERALGRGGGLKHALLSIDRLDKPVLAMNGDVICNLNLKELFAYHTQRAAMATIVSVQLKCPYGVLDIDADSSIKGFKEKPELALWINAGIYIIQPEVRELLPDVGDHEEITFPELAEKGQLQAFQTRAFWKAVDTVKDLNELNAEMEKLFFQAFLQSAH